MKILILVNHYNTLRIFRRELLLELAQMGHELVVSLPPCEEENMRLLQSYGCRLIETGEMDRRGKNPITDLKLLFRYRTMIRKEKPDKVLTYTIKPNIYGGIACKWAGIPYYVNITGLGSAFQKRDSMTCKIASFLYRNSLNKANTIFFENAGNRDVLINSKIARKEQSVVLPGAGVNLQEFPNTPYTVEDSEGIKFLFVGRVMREKGVDELFECIRKLKRDGIRARFLFIGWYEESYQPMVEQMQREKLIEFHGFQEDVRPYIKNCHCVILPSWHEGMSNTLLEGAAMCRPLITSKIHGCMEAVIDGQTGYLFPCKHTEQLYDKIVKFIKLPYEVKRNMGLRGREHMEKTFDKKDVVKKTVQVVFQNGK